MPRLARAVCAGVPHHITQRGNRRERVFFWDVDYICYLEWLKEYASKYEVEILAYCLMPNHIHLIAVPSTEDGLQAVFKPLHMRYAQRINRKRRWKGHLWQGRFFSSPLDDTYLWAAIRYVERNPVRAKMVKKAESFPWSSAAGHCGLKEDSILTEDPTWQKQFRAIKDWSAWLSGKEVTDQLKQLRQNVEKGLPCGSAGFIRKLEKLVGRSLEFRPIGRPRKKED
jgi:putative transposase